MFTLISILLALANCYFQIFLAIAVLSILLALEVKLVQMAITLLRWFQ
jgi:hypothetical protein